MYHFRTRLDPVELAFTDRHGGVDAASAAPVNEAMLADFAPGAAVAGVHQVHGAAVVCADPHRSEKPRADGVVTDRTDVVLLIRVADCVPVLLADPAAGVVGAAHAGREGVRVGIVPATVAAMRELGATRLRAWIGPHVCGACYEVPADLRDDVAAVVPATRATTSWGTPALDLGAGVRSQLEADGVEVVDVSTCTRESADLHSYRRDGDRSGRLAAVVRIHP